jgi:hypothetical protein
MQHVIRIGSHEREELIDITAEIAAFVEKSGVKRGLVSVYAQGSTAAVMIHDPRELGRERAARCRRPAPQAHPQGGLVARCPGRQWGRPLEVGDRWPLGDHTRGRRQARALTVAEHLLLRVRRAAERSARALHPHRGPGLRWRGSRRHHAAGSPPQGTVTREPSGHRALARPLRVRVGPTTRPPLLSTLLDVHRMVPLHDGHSVIDPCLRQANKDQGATPPHRFSEIAGLVLGHA